MISERWAARSFGTLWQETFPMLTPYYMRLFNASHVLDMSSDDASIDGVVGPVLKQYDSPDFVAELAVQFANFACTAGITVEALKKDDQKVRQSWLQAERVVGKYEGVIDRSGFAFSEVALDESVDIAKNIVAFAMALPGRINFCPDVPGAGAIGRCQADLSIGDHLVEIKSVSRRFAAKDLKQVLVYLALDATAGSRRWRQACIVNPRLATWCRFDVEELVRFISGGEPSAVAFSNLINGMSRDVQIDASF